MRGSDKETRQDDALPSQSFRDLCLVALRQGGLRVTGPRLAVIETLELAETPLVPREILAAIHRKALPLGQQNEVAKPPASIDLVSIYRILEALNQLGVVHKVYPHGGYMRCAHVSSTPDCRQGLSRHRAVITTCQSCGRAEDVDIPDSLLDSLLEAVQHRSQFRLRTPLLQIDGFCEACASKNH